MNEQIKLLADQAGISTNIETDYFSKKDMNKWVDYYSEKFAELIVEECLDILNDEDDGSHDGRSVRIAAIRIKKLFGVEE